MAATLEKILTEVQGLRKDITEIKENVRKIMKVVPTENADFEIKGKFKKSTPTHTSNHTPQRLAAKA